ncbi:hypothetical protein JL720_16868 [Aureococcus anophagefferens]|nr:hypothetical protein JL720_16868 [Aureococcus anophagefferens]
MPGAELGALLADELRHHVRHVHRHAHLDRHGVLLGRVLLELLAGDDLRAATARAAELGFDAAKLAKRGARYAEDPYADLAVLRDLGVGADVAEAVPAALYLAHRARPSPAPAPRSSVRANGGGAAAHRGALLGALLGAAHGHDALAAAEPALVGGLADRDGIFLDVGRFLDSTLAAEAPMSMQMTPYRDGSFDHRESEADDFLGVNFDGKSTLVELKPHRRWSTCALVAVCCASFCAVAAAAVGVAYAEADVPYAPWGDDDDDDDSARTEIDAEAARRSSAAVESGDFAELVAEKIDGLANELGLTADEETMARAAAGAFHGAVDDGSLTTELRTYAASYGATGLSASTADVVVTYLERAEATPAPAASYSYSYEDEDGGASAATYLAVSLDLGGTSTEELFVDDAALYVLLASVATAADVGEDALANFNAVDRAEGGVTFRCDVTVDSYDDAQTKAAALEESVADGSFTTTMQGLATDMGVDALLEATADDITVDIAGYVPPAPTAGEATSEACGYTPMWVYLEADSATCNTETFGQGDPAGGYSKWQGYTPMWVYLEADSATCNTETFGQGDPAGGYSKWCRCVGGEPTLRPSTQAPSHVPTILAPTASAPPTVSPPPSGLPTTAAPSAFSFWDCDSDPNCAEQGGSCACDGDWASYGTNGNSWAGAPDPMWTTMHILDLKDADGAVECSTDFFGGDRRGLRSGEPRRRVLSSDVGGDARRAQTREYYGLTMYTRILRVMEKDIGEPVSSTASDMAQFGYLGQWVAPLARTKFDIAGGSHATAMASIEGGVYNNNNLGYSRLPKYLAGGSLYAYTPVSDVGRGWGFQEMGIACKRGSGVYLGLVTMANRVIVPVSGYGEATQDEHEDDGGVFLGAGWVVLPIFPGGKIRNRTTLFGNEDFGLTTWTHVIDTAQFSGPLLAYAPQFWMRRLGGAIRTRPTAGEYDYSYPGDTCPREFYEYEPDACCVNPSVYDSFAYRGADWWPSTAATVAGARTYNADTYDRWLEVFAYAGESDDELEALFANFDTRFNGSYHMNTYGAYFDLGLTSLVYEDAMYIDIENGVSSDEYYEDVGTGDDLDPVETNIFYEWEGAEDRLWTRYYKTTYTPGRKERYANQPGENQTYYAAEPIDESEAPESLRDAEYTLPLWGRANYVNHERQENATFDYDDTTNKRGWNETDHWCWKRVELMHEYWQEKDFIKKATKVNHKVELDYRMIIDIPDNIPDYGWVPISLAEIDEDSTGYGPGNSAGFQPNIW